MFIFNYFRVMKIETINNYIRLLIFLYKNENVELNSIVSRFNIKYTTIHKVLEKWKGEGYITKTRKKIIYLGGDKHEYKISPQGEKFLFDIARELMDINLIEIKEKDCREQILDFCYRLPDYLNDSGIRFKPEQLNSIKWKVEKDFNISLE